MINMSSTWTLPVMYKVAMIKTRNWEVCETWTKDLLRLINTSFNTWILAPPPKKQTFMHYFFSGLQGSTKKDHIPPGNLLVVLLPYLTCQNYMYKHFLVAKVTATRNVGYINEEMYINVGFPPLHTAGGLSDHDRQLSHWVGMLTTSHTSFHGKEKDEEHLDRFLTLIPIFPMGYSRIHFDATVLPCGELKKDWAVSLWTK